MSSNLPSREARGRAQCWEFSSPSEKSKQEFIREKEGLNLEEPTWILPGALKGEVLRLKMERRKHHNYRPLLVSEESEEVEHE